MSLLGGSASSGMQKTYKQNNELGNRKKSLQERTKGYETKSNPKFKNREMTAEQRQAHLERLQKNKRADNIRMVIIFSILGAVVIVGIVFFKMYVV